MIDKVIVPPDRRGNTSPLVTLIGPRAGNYWQNTALECLARYAPDAQVASSKMPFPARNPYPCAEIMAEWERYFMEEAGRDGTAIVWLPSSGNISSHYHDLGRANMLVQELFVRHTLFGLDFILGIDPDFPRAETIRHRFRTHTDVSVFSSLERACYHAAHLLKSSR